MSENFKKTSRREFLELAAAGTAGVAVASLGPRPAVAQTERRDEYKVFSEARIAGVRLKNRLVRSATWEAAASAGEVTHTYIGLHKALAEGGVGMIISGYVAPVELEAAPLQVHVYDDRHIPGLRKVADAVHAADGKCKMFAQIGHGGGTVGPSGIRWPGKRKSKALPTEEVVGALHRPRCAVPAVSQVADRRQLLICLYLAVEDLLTDGICDLQVERRFLQIRYPDASIQCHKVLRRRSLVAIEL